MNSRPRCLKSVSSLRSFVCGLAALLVFFPELSARHGIAPAQINVPLPLHIMILEGEGALNNIHERTAREPVIQVEDANHKPVAEASVLFLVVAGAVGAGASFNAQHSYRAVTDAQGRAVAHGFHPNKKTGKYTIEVAVVVAGITTSIFIHETNARPEEIARIRNASNPANEDGNNSSEGTNGGTGDSAAGNDGAAGSGGGAVKSTSVADSGLSGHITGFFAALSGKTIAVIASILSSVASVATVEARQNGSQGPVEKASKAPEMDPSMALGCLTLLAGSIAVLRRR